MATEKKEKVKELKEENKSLKAQLEEKEKALFEFKRLLQIQKGI